MTSDYGAVKTWHCIDDIICVILKPILGKLAVFVAKSLRTQPHIQSTVSTTNWNLVMPPAVSQKLWPS